MRADFKMITNENGDTIFLQSCDNIDTNVLGENGDIVMITMENFSYEFEIVSVINVIDNGVHRMDIIINPLYDKEKKEIIRKIKINNI